MSHQAPQIDEIAKFLELSDRAAGEYIRQAIADLLPQISDEELGRMLKFVCTSIPAFTETCQAALSLRREAKAAAAEALAPDTQG